MVGQGPTSMFQARGRQGLGQLQKQKPRQLSLSRLCAVLSSSPGSDSCGCRGGNWVSRIQGCTTSPTRIPPFTGADYMAGWGQLAPSPPSSYRLCPLQDQRVSRFSTPVSPSPEWATCCLTPCGDTSQASRPSQKVLPEGACGRQQEKKKKVGRGGLKPPTLGFRRCSMPWALRTRNPTELPPRGARGRNRTRYPPGHLLKGLLAAVAFDLLVKNLSAREDSNPSYEGHYASRAGR